MESSKRQFEGVVVSCKMQKTCVARVDRMVWHSKYRKQYKVSKKFKVHDERNEAQVGDKVVFEETRPLSKDKRWRLVQVLKT
jgi:small subunit ribosomal protein S17